MVLFVTEVTPITISHIHYSINRKFHIKGLESLEGRTCLTSYYIYTSPSSKLLVALATCIQNHIKKPGMLFILKKLNRDLAM